MLVNFFLVLFIVLYFPKFLQYMLSCFVIRRQESKYSALAVGSVSVLKKESFEVSEISVDSSPGLWPALKLSGPAPRT